MNLLKSFDDFQYKHRAVGFSTAIIKHYSEDRGGRSAALITYYLFLSLFPLLFWLSLIANLLNTHFPGASSTLIHGATTYFPVLGKQLNIVAHNSNDTTGGIIVSGLVTLYGVRGTAMAFREIVNDMFMVPQVEREGFPHNWLRGIGIVFIGGGGFVLSAIGYSWALARGHGTGFRILIGIAGVGLLTLVFLAVLKLALPARNKAHKIINSAILMAIGFGLLQFAGSLIVTHSLKHYSDFYTAVFATTLGLLAWIYLETQVLLYSIEIAVVKERKLWPIRLIGARDTIHNKAG